MLKPPRKFPIIIRLTLVVTAFRITHILKKASLFIHDFEDSLQTKCWCTTLVQPALETFGVDVPSFELAALVCHGEGGEVHWTMLIHEFDSCLDYLNLQ